MAAHARLKNEFTEEEKYHNLMRWLNYTWSSRRASESNRVATETWKGRTMAFLCYLLAAFVFGCVFAQIPPRKGLFPRKGPVPATCTWRGKTYPEGKFQPSPCESCECEWPGRALCKSVICGPRTCVDAEFRPDQCCLVCPTGKWRINLFCFPSLSPSLCFLWYTTSTKLQAW